MLTKVTDFDVDTVSVWKSSSSMTANYYIRSDKKPLELQTDWITLGKFPLPGYKYVTDDARNINLAKPADDVLCGKMNSIDEYIKRQSLSDKNYHDFIRKSNKPEEDNANHLKFKLYVDTAYVNKNRIPITSLHDFYQHIKEGTKLRAVFTFSKMWKMSNEYGFSLSVNRIQLGDFFKKEPKIERKKTIFFNLLLYNGYL